MTSFLPELLPDAAGAAALLYAATVSGAALTALLARTSARRRAGREVLRLLLGRPDEQS